MAKARNYKKEYKKFHSSEKAKDDRARRNAAHQKKKPKAGYEVDHKTPLSKGGSNSESNLRVVKRETNRKKGARTDALKKKLKLPKLSSR
jgi:5-methylcytosine-specific restriction endonuclease McrA